MDIQQNMFAKDNLNIYLGIYELKSATLILLNPTIKKIKYTTITTDIKETNEFKKKLDRLNTCYEIQCFKITDICGKKASITEYFEVFNIAKTEQNLQLLVNAKNDYDIGIALGYPEEAVKNYLKVINGERRDGTYSQVSIAKAKQASIPISILLAYISYVPEQLDIVNNDISQTTKKLGETYQNYTTKNHPGLARIVEVEFKNTHLPIKWIKNIKWQYKISYWPENK